MSDIDAISEFLGAKTALSNNIKNPDDIEPIVQHKKVIDNAKSDYHKTRESMTKMIEVGTSAIPQLANLATQAESPRAYEVLNQALKTITEMNKSLMELHKDAIDLEHTANPAPAQNEQKQDDSYYGSVTDIIEGD